MDMTRECKMRVSPEVCEGFSLGGGGGSGSVENNELVKFDITKLSLCAGLWCMLTLLDMYSARGTGVGDSKCLPLMVLGLR